MSITTLFPMEDLDAMIAAGWGDTPRDQIPADWRTNPPTSRKHNQYSRVELLSTKPAIVRRRSADFQKRLDAAARQRAAYRDIAINGRTHKKEALDAHAASMRASARVQGRKSRESIHLTDQHLQA